MWLMWLAGVDGIRLLFLFSTNKLFSMIKAVNVTIAGNAQSLVLMLFKIVMTRLEKNRLAPPPAASPVA